MQKCMVFARFYLQKTNLPNKVPNIPYTAICYDSSVQEGFEGVMC